MDTLRRRKYQTVTSLLRATFPKEARHAENMNFADQLSQTAASLPGANVKHPSSAAVWAYAHLDYSLLKDMTICHDDLIRKHCFLGRLKITSFFHRFLCDFCIPK